VTQERKQTEITDEEQSDEREKTEERDTNKALRITGMIFLSSVFHWSLGIILKNFVFYEKGVLSEVNM